MRTLKLFTTIFVLLFWAYAEASTGISYHGRLMLPSGEAVKTSTQFRIQIRTPGNENCLMYEETTTRDLSLTDGVFSITIGDGTGSRTDTLGMGLDTIFANRSKFVFTANCAIVTDYTPNAADGRRLQVSFNDGTFVGWEDLPVQNIGFAPISIESLQVGGFKASHLLRVADGAGVPQNVAALTPAYFAELVALAAGTSTVYAKAGAISGNDISTGTIGGATIIDTTGTVKATSVSATTGGFNTLDIWKADNSNKVSLKASNSQSANYVLTLPVDDGAAGQVLSTDGSGLLSWANPGAGGTGTVTNVTSANLYLTVATGTTTPALTLNVGTAANTVAAGDDARFTDSRAPTGNAGADLTGTYPDPTVAKIRGNGVTAGAIPGADIGKVYRWDGTNLTAAFLTFGDLRTAAGAQQLAAVCAANEKIQWSVITDAFTCQAIGSLNASAITAGTLDAARLPASATLWQDGGTNRIYYSAANVGIGVAAPATSLHVVSTQPSTTSAPDRAGFIVDGEGTSYGARIAARAFSATEGAIFGGYRSLGPKSGLATVTSGKGLVSLMGYGYDGSGWSSNSSSPNITLESTETWGGTAKGSRITFSTTANTSTVSTERMRIDQNGYVGIGTGSAALTSLLEVNGAGSFTSVTAPTGNFTMLNAGGVVVNGTNGFAPVMSLRNQSATGFSGTYMTDTTGASRGLLGYGNASSTFPGAIVLGSTDNSTPLVFGVNGAETARILATNGFFGIGTNNPLTPLHVDINAATAVATFENSTGSCSITPNTSSLSCSSDIRLKRNVESILGLTALNQIIQLQAKTYEWKGGDNSRHIGFIAQEAEKIVPELVTEDAKGFKQISYSGFVPLLSEAIKEVHSETQEQKRQIAAIDDDKKVLEAEVIELKKKNAALEERLRKIEELLSK